MESSLGEFPELTAKGIPVTGTESYGGPLVTAVISSLLPVQEMKKSERLIKELVKSLGIPIAGRRVCNTNYLQRGWKTVCCDCRWWG